MKKSTYKVILFALACLIVWACNKDEIKAYAHTGDAGTLTASQTTLVLTAANASDTVESFSWTPTEYGFQAAVKYTLQIARAGSNFTSPKEISVGSSTRYAYTGADLNQLSIILGLAPGSPGQLEVRVKSSISDSIPGVYLNKVTLTVTPYLVIINYPSLWVPGDYQGWDPATAPKISSKADNGIYEGYTQIGGSLKFKFTSHPDWNHTNYGLAASATSGDNVSGTFNTTGGDLSVPVSGYYLIKANTNNNTWSAAKTTWGLIGDAVPVTGWDSDQDLSYNASTKKWTVTLNLVTGNLKFRANDDWALNFGDDKTDLSLEYAGANIPVAAAGNYTVTLDLSAAGNYSYSVKKN